MGFKFNPITGSLDLVGGGGGGTPGGSDTHVQFNNSGAFGGDSNFTWNNTTKKLTLGVSGSSGGGFEVTGPILATFYTPAMVFNPANGAFSAGYNCVASGTNSIAMGRNADTVTSPSRTVEATGTSAVSIHGRATAARAIAIGGNARATADSAFAIGNSALASGQRAIAIGNQSTGVSPTTDTFAIGLESTALGAGAQATGDSSVSIGRRSQTTGTNAIALGNLAVADSGVAIGNAAQSLRSDGIAIGARAEVSVTSGAQGVAIGVDSRANGLYPLSLGKNTDTNADYAITIGGGQNSPQLRVLNNINNSILLGFNFGTQQNLLHAESAKGVRIGATSGETQTMDGDDLYVKGFIETDGGIYDDSQTANTLIFLNANKKITSITDGTAGQVLTTNGAGTYTFQDSTGGGSTYTDITQYTLYGGY
jgi:hypothetical protein